MFHRFHRRQSGTIGFGPGPPLRDHRREHDDVLKLLTKLQAAHPGTELRCCYEAGPHGFSLARCLHRHGYVYILVAPSKIPRQPGDRIKTNRRDADQLARLYRAGELTGIYVPDPADEAIPF